MDFNQTKAVLRTISFKEKKKYNERPNKNNKKIQFLGKSIRNEKFK
jgi:hypothetical protein